jgi:hypothetical protein
MLGESGVTHMGFGTESTSEMLKIMNKRHQRVNENVRDRSKGGS